MGFGGPPTVAKERRQMSDSHAGERLSTMTDGFAEHLERVKQAQQQRAQIVVEAHAASDRVTVQVHADGAVVDMRFSQDANDLAYHGIATAALRPRARWASGPARSRPKVVFD